MAAIETMAASDERATELAEGMVPWPGVRPIVHRSGARLWIGTSGWVYNHWRDVYYPRGLPQSAYLPFYAREFPTVEINYSFYQLPPRERFAAWRAGAPSGFCFAAKASRYLTHMKKLRDPEEPLARLLDACGGLEEKLGPILFQFPRQWEINLERLRAFLALLPRGEGEQRRRFAFEFRHASWLVDGVFRALADAGCALCLPDAPGMPRADAVTADFTYIRMHTGATGVAYGRNELETWANRIEGFLERAVDVFVYFNNDPGGAALANARELIASFH